MKTIRLFFEKSGRAVYISHLDLMRAMGRALVRSALPVWYTQGFHPHLYLTFALPLSLGTTGLRETMDFRLTDEVPNDAIVSRLNAALPAGLRALSADVPVMEPTQIMWADYSIDLRCDPARGRAALEAFCALPEILAEKHGKKGIKTMDIRPLLRVLSCEETPNGVALGLRCRAGVEINLNPALALEALCRTTGLLVAQSSIARIAVLDENLCGFQ